MFPFLDNPTVIQLSRGKTIGITFNLYRETMQFKKDAANNAQDNGPMSKAAIAGALHTGDSDETIDNDYPPMLVVNLKARTAAMLKAAELKAMKIPKLMISDTCKQQSLSVVDMDPAVLTKRQDWEQRYEGRRFYIDDNEDIGLERTYTHSLNVKEYPLQAVYCDNSGHIATPLAFLWPSIKAFMDVCLADPYYFNERTAVTMPVIDLVGIESRSVYNVKRGEISLTDFAAEYERAKEALKKL
jgi:hypothetical protein